MSMTVAGRQGGAARAAGSRSRKTISKAMQQLCTQYACCYSYHMTSFAKLITMHMFAMLYNVGK